MKKVLIVVVVVIVLVLGFFVIRNVINNNDSNNSNNSNDTSNTSNNEDNNDTNNKDEYAKFDVNYAKRVYKSDDGTEDVIEVNVTLNNHSATNLYETLSMSDMCFFVVDKNGEKISASESKMAMTFLPVERTNEFEYEKCVENSTVTGNLYFCGDFPDSTELIWDELLTESNVQTKTLNIE